jgi:hypothetical protein
VKVIGDFTEGVGILHQHAGDLTLGAQDVVHDHEAFAFEMLLLGWAQDSHGWPDFSASECSNLRR